MAYRKDDIPKVTIEGMKIGGKELAEEIADSILNGNFDLGIEKIAKDIAKRQDNAMAMEFTKYIGELLRKNGVVPKISEYRMENHAENHAENKIEMRYGVSIDELDFSAHDKVFEDKIANLEKQIDRLNGEKSILRTRCMPYIERDFDNGLYGKLAIVGCNEEFVDIQKYADGDDLYSREVRNLISEGGIKRLIGQYRNISARLDQISAENKELKQRIAELESRETLELPFDALETANYLINATYERETNGFERTFHNLPDKVNSDRYTVDDLEQIAEHLLVYCKHNKESE